MDFLNLRECQQIRPPWGEETQETSSVSKINQPSSNKTITLRIKNYILTLKATQIQRIMKRQLIIHAINKWIMKSKWNRQIWWSSKTYLCLNSSTLVFTRIKYNSRHPILYTLKVQHQNFHQATLINSCPLLARKRKWTQKSLISLIKTISWHSKIIS